MTEYSSPNTPKDSKRKAKQKQQKNKTCRTLGKQIYRHRQLKEEVLRYTMEQGLSMPFESAAYSKILFYI